MIILDLSNVMVSTLMVQLGKHTNAQIDESMLRHMVLNTIRANYKKFADEYGELVIAADDKNYWRKKVFPYYKAMRKKNREDSGMDWNAIFTSLNKIREELKVYFPYKVIQIESAEADDIIAALCQEFGQQLASGQRILIISADKDMTQLQKFANVDQWDPTRKRWLRNNNQERNLFEHIVKGDRGDGIPSVRGGDDSIVAGVRAKPVTKKMIDQWWENIDTMDSETRRNFERNKLLIDFEQIPEDIRKSVIDEFNNQPTKDRSKLFNYFIENRLRNLMDAITDF